jgi:para-aminobenzoate synthetase component 1
MADRPTLPLVYALDMERALSPLRSLAHLRHPFMLHSGLQAGGPRSRWSLFGADPFALFRDGDHLQAIEAFRRTAERAPENERVQRTGAPFWGGAVGYWAYDYGRRLETLPTHAHDDLKLPDFIFALYDVVGAYDHDTSQAWLFSSGLPFEGPEAVTRAQERLEYFKNLLLAPARNIAPASHHSQGPAVQCSFTPEGYMRAVDAVKDHIRRGDLFQANLTQRWIVPQPKALELSLALYESLVQHSPAPYGAYLRYDDHAVLSASPERFLELRGQHVETRPIKGTRPRGATPEADAALAAELQGSAKDKAENVMIVDVLRNDLGRVCETGTVKTTALCELESFAQVHHLVSTVTGRLADDKDAFDLLHACFPGGSITGAPKIRAMEVLEDLEPVRRHLYTGAIGWLGWDGDVDWNIAIRTAVATQDQLIFHAGGGITADSDPESEYRESLDKAEGMRLAFSKVLGELSLTPTAKAGAGA